MQSGIPCAQCGEPAERCPRCGVALCARRLCAELHEASCHAVESLPPLARSPEPQVKPPAREGKVGQRARRAETEQTRLNLARDLMDSIRRHRSSGRTALLKDDLDRAFRELWAARSLEVDLENLGPSVGQILPPDWEIATDLVPLARALSARGHGRASDVWRSVLEDGVPRSIQAEAAEWLAREAYGRGDARTALRLLHAGSLLGRKMDNEALRSSYKQAGLNPNEHFALYLTAVRLDPFSARAAGLQDPLTQTPWPDQDPHWWRDGFEAMVPWANRGTKEPVEPAYQREALSRAGDLAVSSRDEGWLLLAEGDFLAGPTGARFLGRSLRTGVADSTDHDLFIRVRMAYESAADRIPDVAWPWYRLAELLAWAGFGERAEIMLRQADRRKLGDQTAEREHRPVLRALVQSGLGNAVDGTPVGPKPFPTAPHGPHFMWRLRLLPGA